MQTGVQLSGHAPWQADCLLLPVFEDEPFVVPHGFAEELPWLAGDAAWTGRNGRNGSLTLCHAPTGGGVAKVLAVGLGRREASTPDAVRETVASAARYCRGAFLSRLAFAASSLDCFEGSEKRGLWIRECLIAVALAVYKCLLYRSRRDLDKDDAFACASLDLLYTGSVVPPEDDRAYNEAESLIHGLKLARDLVNGPANVVTPAYLAAAASDIAGRHGFACRVLNLEEMRSRGMNALLAVAQGSHTEPRFIILEHAPAGLENAAPLVLVGKGVTFDSGGISLKPSTDLHRLKGDMAGAAAVLGVFESLGRTKDAAAHRVVGLMPCAENMPGGGAARPGDIITAMSGTTIEIVNTDAEGRLLLCDALTLAQEQWTPRAVVDIATLTGACAVALGRSAGGLFCDDAELRERIYALGQQTGDTVWPLPLWKSILKNIRSNVADIANAGVREGGAIQAAMFLKHFVADTTPWAHLDIAGAASAREKQPLRDEGATGFGLRILYHLAKDGICPNA